MSQRIESANGVELQIVPPFGSGGRALITVTVGEAVFTATAEEALEHERAWREARSEALRLEKRDQELNSPTVTEILAERRDAIREIAGRRR